MLNTHRLIGTSLFVLFLFSAALAQESRAPIETPREPAASPMVTATATAKRVRFVSPGTAVRLRLEVYNETGQKLFDTELHGGNVLDWHLQNGAGQRLPAGSYACVLTIKSLSGRLSQRVGLLSVTDHEAAIEVAGVAQLSSALQQTIGPVEGNAAFTVLQESETDAITAVTHDGQIGQVTSTAGALTFRTGDLFSGQDVERVRITPEGKVGIGTDKPEATLDVAGSVRAAAGFRFSDGTTLDSTDGKLNLRDVNGELSPAPLAAGTGTLGKLAKWTETGGAGTLGDSVVTEAGGKLGIGTANPNYEITLFGNDVGLQLVSPATGSAATDGLRFGIDSTNKAFLFNSETTDMYFGTNATERMRITSGGNVGIGTSAPTAKLDVLGTAQVSSNLTVDTNTLFVNAANNQVGIGTTTPGVKLDVLGSINTTTQYNIGGNRVLSNAGTGNLFAGRDAGNSNTGLFNSFFGASSGIANTTGFANSFFGATVGGSNTDGFSNSFFGFGSGNSNLSGDSNSFFGVNAGFSNTTANNNSFFGTNAGEDNTIGSSNAFFGFQAGQSNTVGGRNSFFGFSAGSLNGAGSRNSSFGTEAGMSNTGQDNVFVGDKAGMLNTQGILNTFIGAGAGENNITGSNNTALGADTFIEEGLSFATAIGSGARAFRDNTIIIGRSSDEVWVQGFLYVSSAANDPALNVSGNGSVFGTLEVHTLGTVGAETLCRNVNTHKIALCSSSLRYKTDIVPFTSGLNLVNRLRPISFTWKEAGRRDLGLGAEDVEKVEPLLVTYNDKGEVEGVKYDRVAVVLLNAVKEQQLLITKQEQQLKRQQSASLKQQRQLNALRKLVCRNNPRAEACK